MRSTRAIVRPPGATYPKALTRLSPPPPVDLELARAQHGGYVATLRRLGLEVIELPADDEHADAVFVQDRVCALDGRAIVGPSAVESRRGEEAAIVKVIARCFPVVELSPPACLDWGDVLVTEDALFVGLSERSNPAAVNQLREMLAPGRMVESVCVPPDLLHLLSGCSYLGDRTVLAVASLEEFFRSRGFRVVSVPDQENLAGNVLAVGIQAVVPSGYPQTRTRIEAAGFRAHPVPVGEFEKRDGGVTCLSVLY